MTMGFAIFFIPMVNCCRIKARKECHQIHALKKNHAGECKSARVEFESVDVICKKIQASLKCSMMRTLFSAIKI